jgi:hypothetical protein
MTTRDLVELLKGELEFLELGGYDHAMGSPWRPAFVFEDSPTCMNFREATKQPCSECPLMAFVPAEHRDKEPPCRFIPLNRDGQTLNSLYASASHRETVEVVRRWLRTTIAKLERRAEEQERPARAS